MNIAVINVKNLLKYILKFCLMMLLFLGLISAIKTKKKLDFKEKIKIKKGNINKKALTQVLDLTLISLKNDEKKTNDLKITNKKIIAMELGITEDVKRENIPLESMKTEENLQKKVYNSIEEIPTEVTIEEVSENNIEPKSTNSYGSVKIDNQSDYEITENMLIPDEEITNKKDILIYHTHTCESYTPSEEYNYEMTGNYRTTDLNYSVARVGTELAKYLESKGFNVEHNTTYHDYPAYSGSYSRALSTIQNLLVNKNTNIVIDLHRDAVGSSNEYAPRVKINEQYASQMMFVIGTDGGGLEHPNWNQNLKIAVKIQEKANEMYPGLFRPIIIRNSRYNQHVAKGACIIEVGATGNTLDECILSMQCLANILEEVCK